MLKTFALLGRSDSPGAALSPVGALAVDGPDHAVSWIPMSNSTAWVQRLEATEAARHDDWEHVADEWSERANGITWDLHELEVPEGETDVTQAAERLVDLLLANPSLMNL